MKHNMNIKRATNILQALLIMLVSASLIACGPGADSKEDKIKPVVTLTSLNNGEEVIGKFTITWDTDEANPSAVDIYLSRDSGETFPEAVEIRLPDTGSYEWDSDAYKDCRNCRIRITSRDIVGNVGEPADSSMDFVINNVPQVYGSALYYDANNDGPGLGDTVVVSFDKEINIKEPLSHRELQLRVFGDSFGDNATINAGPATNQLTITMDSAVPHLHVGGTFSTSRIHKTAPSGIDIIEDLPTGTITARDTGRTAEPSGGVDVVPTFRDSGQTPDGGYSSFVALGDIDSDGDLDLVLGKWYGANQIWLNNTINPSNTPGQEGVFTNSGQILGGSGSSTIAVVLGDIDNDGDLDMITVNEFDPNRVWLNNNGEFTDSGQELGDSNILSTSIVLGDIDGDGDLDMAVANNGINRILLNNNGEFTDSRQELGNNDSKSVTLGDVDGDGDLDMVVGNNGTNRVWLNNNGEFTDSGQELGNNDSRSITLDDVDGDRDLDIVVGNNGANRVWLNNNGEFTNSGQELGNSYSQSVALGDVDGDGDQDLVVGNKGVNRVWFNSNGKFTDSGQMLGVIYTNSVSLALGDVDGDGDLDMTVGNYLGINRVWLNSQRHPSAELFIDSGQMLGSSNTNSVVLGDVDGDGDLDLVTGDNDTNRVWHNNISSAPGQEGVFTNSQSLGIRGGTQSVVLGDVDRDGDLDLVTGVLDGPNQVWLNNIRNIEGQEGIFTDSEQTLGSNYTQSVVLGDIDRDGDLDLMEGNVDANRIWINNIDNTSGEEGKFTDLGRSLGTSGTTSIVLGDVDGDGDLDLVEGGWTSSNWVWLNNVENIQGQEGVFTTFPQSLGDSSTTSTVLGDIDKDGDLDLIMGNNLSNQIWLNNNGEFTAAEQTLGTSNTRSVALGDIDGDGDLDLVTGNYNQANQVWLNNNGKFIVSEQALNLGTSNTRSIVLGDVDGDGDLDLVIGNYGDPNQVYLNDY